MNKYIIIFFILITGCGDKTKTSNSDAQSNLKFESVNKIGEGLTIEFNNNKYKIDIADSLFIYSISPDSSLVLVNYRVMSNIQISRLYKLDKDSNETSLIEQNLSTSVWDSISHKFKIHKDDIINPRTRANFTKDNKIKVQVNGQTELGLIINEVIKIE